MEVWGWLWFQQSLPHQLASWRMKRKKKLWRAQYSCRLVGHSSSRALRSSSQISLQHFFALRGRHGSNLEPVALCDVIMTSPTGYWRPVWKLQVGFTVSAVLSLRSVLKLEGSIFGCVGGTGSVFPRYRPTAGKPTTIGHLTRAAPTPSCTFFFKMNSRDYLLHYNFQFLDQHFF